MPVHTMLRHCLLAAALLLCGYAHAQDTASPATINAADASAQATPDGANTPQTFESPFCQSVLPGCQQCTLFIVKTGAQTASTPDAATTAATPDTFGRKVYVCTQCLPGFVLSGSGNLNDPNPRFCVPEAGPPTPCTAIPPSDPRTTTGFTKCPLSTPGATCRAECAPSTFGPGLQAQCVVDPATKAQTWEITGFCSEGTAVCPPTPLAGSGANSFGFQNCATNLGATCTAACAIGASGPGYTARCTLVNQRPAAVTGVPAWIVQGSCRPPGTTVGSCRNNCGKRNLIDAKTQMSCYCDYWCNLYDDCCGGMNAAAATAKDAACPKMVPKANKLSNVLTCSNKRGLYAGVDSCTSFRPGNCWCDKFCTAARDCCDNCPLECAATCPARTRSAVVAESVDSAGKASLRGVCGATAANQQYSKIKEALLSKSTGVSPAAWTDNFESRCQRCQAALIQTDLAATTITIPTYIANVGVGDQAAEFDKDRADSLIGRLNAAYARSGFQFNLEKYVEGFTFKSPDTLDGADCAKNQGATPFDPNCERCRIYRQIVPTSSQGSKVLVIYMRPGVPLSGTPVVVGSATFPQLIYNPSPTSNVIDNSCLDGVYGITFAAENTGLEGALARDATNIIHETGHWLGLHHPWNQNQDTKLTDEELCAQQTGPNYNSVDFVAASGISDGVRDTPPQLPARSRENGKLEFKPQFFGCLPDGSFSQNPFLGILLGPAKACDGLPPTGGKYYNNFNNAMSYYDGDCDSRKRAKTFSAGQLARMRCVWSCYRDNQCGTGSFFG